MTWPLDSNQPPSDEDHHDQLGISAKTPNTPHVVGASVAGALLLRIARSGATMKHKVSPGSGS